MSLVDLLADEMVDAVVENDVDRITALLASGMAVDACNERGETALSYACAYNSLSAARLLVSMGADINRIDPHGFTPLDTAVCNSSPEFREWLTGIGGLRNLSHEPWPWPPKNH